MENPSAAAAKAIPERPLLASPSSMALSLPDLSLSFENLQLCNHIHNDHQLGPSATSPPSESLSMYSGYGYGNRNMSGGIQNQESLNYGKNSVIDVLECLKDCNLFLMAVKEYGLEGGCKYLQRLLTHKNPKMTAQILHGVLDFVFELMNNQYGHHLLVMLIELCNEYQLLLIITKVTTEKGRFVHTLCTQHGSNSIKRLIRVLKKSPLVSHMVLAISSEFYSIMTDQKAKNVIIACLDLLDDSQNEMLYALAKRNCIGLAMDQEGCPSLNNFISSSRGQGRRELLEAITHQSLYLSKDSLGNYVVQHILELGDPIFIAKICEHLRGHYVELSLQKSGSHVVEKCIKSIGIRYVVSEFLCCGSNMLVKVARNQFGNYVIQTALRATKVLDFQLHGKLLMALHENLHKLQCVYGRNVLSLVNKLTDGI